MLFPIVHKCDVTANFRIPKIREQHGALSAILSRLQRLEEQNNPGSPSFSSEITPAPQSQGATPDNSRSQNRSSFSRTQPSGPSRHLGSPVSIDSVCFTSTALPSSQPGLGDSGETTAFDATSILSYAVDQVQQLRKKHNFGVTALTVEPITIPPEYAKQWIDSEPFRTCSSEAPLLMLVVSRLFYQHQWETAPCYGRS